MLRKLLCMGHSEALLGHLALADIASLAASSAALNVPLAHWLERQRWALTSLATLLLPSATYEELRSLTLLHLDGRRLGDADMHTLVAALGAGALPCLLSLHCSHDALRLNGLAVLASTRSFVHLRELWLDGNEVCAESLLGAWGCHRSGLPSLPSLEDLYLSSNPIGCLGLEALASAFQHAVLPRALLQLDLACCGIGDAGLAALAAALTSHGILDELELLGLSRNRIGCAGLASLAGAVASGALPVMEQFELGSNRIADAGVCALAGALRDGKWAGLHALLLYDNLIDDGGVQTLTAALDAGCLKSLCFLSLEANPASPGSHASAAASLNSRKRCARRRWMELSYEREQAAPKAATHAATDDAATASAAATAAADRCCHEDKPAPLILHALLDDAEIAQIDAAARELALAESCSAWEGCWPTGPPMPASSSSRMHRYTPSHHKLFLHAGGYFQSKCAALSQRLLARMRTHLEGDFDSTAPGAGDGRNGTASHGTCAAGVPCSAGAVTDQGAPLRTLAVRTIEYHTYTAGGSLLDPAHRDHGSVLSLSVLLLGREQHTGGAFITWEGGKPVSHPLERGDGILFRSEQLHNVSAVTEGLRNALVIELWEGSENRTDRYV